MSIRTSSFSSAMGSNIVGEVLIRIPQLIVDLWLMRLLTISQFGVWIGLRTMLQFTTFFGSIPLVALDVHYGQRTGAMQLDSARALAGSAFVGSGLFSFASLLVMLMGVMSSDVRGLFCPGATQSECLVLVAVVCFQSVYLFLLTHVRNQLRFTEANVTSIASNALYLVLVVALVPRWQVNGAMSAFGASLLFCLVAWARLVDVRFGTWREQFNDCLELCRSGFSLAIVGLMMTSLRLMTRPVVAQELGVDALGIYGMASVFGGLAMFLGGASSRVALQFCARAEGAQIDRAAQSLRFGLSPSLWVAGACCLAGTAVVGAGECLLPIFADRHEELRMVLRPLCIGAAVHAIAAMLSSTFRAQSRQGELIGWTGAAMLIQAGLLALASRVNAPLWCYAVCDSVTLLAYSALLVCKMEVPREERRRFLAMIGWMLLLTTIGNEVASFANQSAGTAMGTKIIVSGLCGLFAAVFWMPFAWRLSRRWDALQAQPTTARTSFGADEEVIPPLEQLAA
jgi:O-antigen/teichoic acid export membrane protein